MNVIPMILIVIITIFQLVIISKVLNYKQIIRDIDPYELEKNYLIAQEKSQKKFRNLLLSSIVLNLVFVFLFALVWMFLLFYMNTDLSNGFVPLNREVVPWILPGFFYGLTSSISLIFGLIRFRLKEEFIYFLMFYNETYKLYGSNAIGKVKILLYVSVIIGFTVSLILLVD